MEGMLKWALSWTEICPLLFPRGNSRKLYLSSLQGREKMNRFFTLLSSVLVVFLLGLTTQYVDAQPYPNRSIQIINTIPAGGGGDITGRILAEELEKILKVQMITVNKPGGSDTLGTDLAVRAKKDGYTLLYGSTMGMVYVRVTQPEIVPYDPIKDLEHLGIHSYYPMAVAVQTSSPWKTYAELIEYAKQNPEKLRVSTSGIGSTANFNLEITQFLTGAKFTHVPMGGGPATITALLGGHVEVCYDQLGKFLPHVESGKMRLLLTGKKMPSFPDLPTLRDLGYQQDLLTGWFALCAPAGVPEEVKSVLVPAVEKAVKNPESKMKLEKMGFTVDYKSPPEVRKMIAQDYETAMGIAAKIGLGKQTK